MRITWYGHAAFLFETAGLRIIFDPYRSPDSGGYLPIDEPADVVVVSHENDRYHSHLGQIIPPFEVIRGPEIIASGRDFGGILFEAIPCFESPEKLPGDEVTILHFRSEGIRVVHLGDLGHALTDEEIVPIRGAEVVLVPAGGRPTIDFELIPALLDAIGPKIVIPMHYKTPGIDLNIQPVERFFEALPDWPVERVSGCSIELTGEASHGERRIISLEHAR